MHSTSKKLLALLLTLAMVLTMLPTLVFAANEKPAADEVVTIEFLGTSDVHGQLYATDYTADSSTSGTYKRGLTRVATYVKEQRAAYNNVFLVDTGDLSQGTPLTYYYDFQKPNVEDPAMKALRTMGYDMFVVGNHEFNYGMTILQRQLKYLTSDATATESQVSVSVANYLDASTNSADSKDWKTWNSYEPYHIYDYDGVKVAVIGLGNPNVPKWDVPENWKGIYFAGVIETYKHYEAEMKSKAGMIVVVTHSGVNSDPDSDFIEELIKETNSVDLVFSGHEHNNKVWKIQNSDGKEINVIQPYTKARAIGQAVVQYNKTTKTISSIDAKTVNMENYAIDSQLAAVLKPYETATWNEYMLNKIGTAAGNYPAANLGTAPSAFMDLINSVQLWGAYDRTKKNTPSDTSDDTMAQLSISAPLTSGDAANLISTGDIMLGDMFKLYRYENWFYQITMSGREVREWLEFAATKIKLDTSNNPTVSASDLTYYDVIMGDGFSYKLDASRPLDSRVVSMTYKGAEVKDTDKFTVVVNNYRYNGGGNYVAWLNAHGCSFTANDQKRVIYSTEYDMLQGEDLGQARNLLAAYIQEKGTITPTITSTWSVVVGDTDAYHFEVLSTTDMHGRATTSDVSTQKVDANSMERVATIVTNERATYGNNLLVIDDGDLIQGTLVAQYAINKKADVENPMITALKTIGYDVYNMGNHEFNFTPAQRDTQVSFARAANIAVTAANIVLKTDGKNSKGESVKAGDPYYDPYYIKTLDAGNGRTVRVAVIGLGNAANATWDLETNYPNLQFNSLDNPTGLLENEINKWSSYLVTNKLADIIIVAAHSGFGSDDGITSPNFMLESQAKTGTKNAHNIDLMICGHDHSATIQTVKNADGKDIYIVDGGGTTVTENVFTVTFNADKSVKDFTVTAKSVALATAKGDEALGSTEQHWFDETYAWASTPLGTFNNGWNDVTAEATGKTNNDMVLQQTSLMNFVHKAQIWSTWQSYESKGIAGAIVSIASPVFGKGSDGTLSFVPKDGDTVSMLELSKLYRYSNNLMCAVDMTGRQLYNWMSKVADMYTIKDGKAALADGVSIYGVDTFYGVDYTFDLTRPVGHRIASAKINGVDLLKYDGKIRVALNSYRLSGGYGFADATGLSEKDCCWTASQYLGSDRSPVPTQLGEYVSFMKTVSPKDKVSHGTDSTWTLSTVSTITNPFTDVKESDYFYEAVLNLHAQGVIGGTSATTFTPNGKLTRGQIVALLYQMDGTPAPTAAAPFKDVTSSDYYAKAVAWAYENKITAGITPTAFNPKGFVTREQMVTFLYSMARYQKRTLAKDPADITTYSDYSTVSAYAREPLAWAVGNGMVSGVGNNMLSPKTVALRGQAAVVLFRYQNAQNK